MRNDIIEEAHPDFEFIRPHCDFFHQRIQQVAEVHRVIEVPWPCLAEIQQHIFL